MSAPPRTGSARSLAASASTIVISRAPRGYQVTLSPERDDRRFDQWCTDVEYARSYASGLQSGTGWPIEDRTTGKIVVEQLNASQWHASFPHGIASGVSNYVDALAYALIVAACEGWAVETHTLDGDRMLMMHPSATAAGGAA